MSTILVTGGAGYIGAQMVRYLMDRGWQVCVLDNLSTGQCLPPPGAGFVRGDVRDAAVLDAVFRSWNIQAVMHFAALSQVAESVREPQRYFDNNVAGSRQLVHAMQRHGVSALVFSSTAAVYGQPQRNVIDESQPLQPINPYGESKLQVEQLLEQASGLRSVAFRYFNAAGADARGRCGEDREPETHLLPLLLRSHSGRGPRLTIFGTDYPTADGTCVRDYVHVEDICSAHYLALQHLLAGGPSRRYNLGNGQGFSVSEVLNAVEEVLGVPLPVLYGPRRPGDPATLVADAGRIQRDWGWQPVYSQLQDMIAHAWRWEQHLAARSLGCERALKEVAA